MKQVDGQIDFIADGFGRDRCKIDSKYPCTHYWAKWTKQMCGDGYCNKMCCFSCKDKKLCGYACNASRSIKKAR